MICLQVISLMSRLKIIMEIYSFEHLANLTVSKRLGTTSGRIEIHFLSVFNQSCNQSPRSSVGEIVVLGENADENQPLIGCLISFSHSLLIKIRAILIIKNSKCYYIINLSRNKKINSFLNSNWSLISFVATKLNQ